jgi:hypothetical protein
MVPSSGKHNMEKKDAKKRKINCEKKPHVQKKRKEKRNSDFHGTTTRWMENQREKIELVFCV